MLWCMKLAQFESHCAREARGELQGSQSRCMPAPSPTIHHPPTSPSPVLAVGQGRQQDERGRVWRWRPGPALAFVHHCRSLKLRSPGEHRFVCIEWLYREWGALRVVFECSDTFAGSIDVSPPVSPQVPRLLELVGLGYTGWFTYRYLLFKSSREELLDDIESLKSKIAGEIESK